jgi:TetR/AcrR family transcriptional regulator
MVVGPEQGKRPRMSAADRRELIINSAREVFLESGFNGTRTRIIAERSGITEAFLYRHFSSKEEIYREAIEVPLRLASTELVKEIKQLATDETVPRAKILERANEILLTTMVEIAPMMAVALFSDLTRGKELYKNSIRPPLQEAIQTIITDISGWDPPHVDMNVIVEGFFGLHYGVALEGLLGIRDIDIKDTARQITMIFAGGVRERDSIRATDLQKP